MTLKPTHPITRLLPKLRISNTSFYDGTACWELQKGLACRGYGQVGAWGKNLRAHRIMYLFYYNDLDPELVVHHLCYTRNCVNPLHLKQITSKENILDKGSNALAKINADKNFCDHGHEFTPENTYCKKSNGSRCCRECYRKASREWKARNRKKIMVIQQN